mmetsp:Transcript_31986/g.67695  ORF Transcript_31986/g.67695 Transcript_31986/m.67695 type:complete len:117 (+) Transcript_31986:172-522(+)
MLLSTSWSKHILSEAWLVESEWKHRITENAQDSNNIYQDLPSFGNNAIGRSVSSSLLTFGLPTTAPAPTAPAVATMAAAATAATATTAPAASRMMVASRMMAVTVSLFPPAPSMTA